MKIDLHELLLKPGAKLREEWEEEVRFDDFSFSGPLRCCFSLTNLDQRILAQGTVDGTVILLCGACLVDFLQQVHVELCEEFLPQSRVSSLYGPEVSLEEMAVFTYDEDEKVLDLSEPARQALLLNLPMHPLCSPECKGLCVQCGKNRNEGDCGCPIEMHPSQENRERNYHAES